uniref:Glycerophosphocholine phosphodiesterase GPCPD1 (inferred by orthology to a human protein) n=1 Tax=Strongyloides venezuelensis TaxID=75913 RepID=A0A0K0F5F9_STRVS
MSVEGSPTVPGKVKLYFTVSVPGGTKSYEKVFVTGSATDLGIWDPKGALELTPCSENNEVWKGTIATSLKKVEFRYFIGYYLERNCDDNTEEEKTLIISQWESFFKPRAVMLQVESNMRNGVCREKVNDEFGFHAGRSRISHGWLHDKYHNEILLRIGGNPLKFFKGNKVVEDTFRIKVTPLDVRYKSYGEESDDDGENSQDNSNIKSCSVPSFSETDVAPLSKENPIYKRQHEYGEKFKKGVDYFMFRTQSVSVEYLGFCIEIFVERTNKESGLLYYSKKCTAFAFPSSLPDTSGKTQLPLMSKNAEPIGKIEIDYLVVKPLQAESLIHSLTMEKTFIRHWKKRSTVEVGHRGMGDSYTKHTAARENTIHSLNSAAENGADMVEFDVQLTKDKKAVIFHDFHVLVSVAKKNGSNINTGPEHLKVTDSISSINSDDSRKSSSNDSQNSVSEQATDLYELAVKDLTLQQLKLLHLDHVKHKSINWDKDSRVTSNSNECQTRHSFPTLTEALLMVDKGVGFNIEVKYPIIQIDGVHECSNYFERNEFVDVILSDVLAFAGDRRIVFSSFDPDTCLMISLKQNKYPVLFLSVGNDTKYMVYKDERTHSSLNAVHFVAGTSLLGVNFHSEDVLKDQSSIEAAKNYGLVVFVWGDELNDKKHVEYFKKVLKVDGIIYDRIGLGENRRNIFTVEKEMRRALFDRIVNARMDSSEDTSKCGTKNLQKFCSITLGDPIYDIDEYKHHRKQRAWSPDTFQQQKEQREKESKEYRGSNSISYSKRKLSCSKDIS